MTASGPIGEQRRLALLNRLYEVLGEEEASTLMESLPAVYWGQLATKDDLKHTNEAIEANKAAIEANKVAIEASEQRLRTEMNAGFANIRTEMNAGFANIRTEMNAEFQTVRSDMALQFAKQLRTMVFTMMGLAMPILGTILAVGLT